MDGGPPASARINPTQAEPFVPKGFGSEKPENPIDLGFRPARALLSKDNFSQG